MKTDLHLFTTSTVFTHTTRTGTYTNTHTCADVVGGGGARPVGGGVSADEDVRFDHHLDVRHVLHEHRAGRGRGRGPAGDTESHRGHSQMVFE